MMNGTSAVDLATLRGAIARPIVESEAEIGVALRHVESGMEVLIDADARYPMASVCKIPILVEALARVGEGRPALDTRVELRAEDRVPPSGVLVTLEPGLRPTLKDLLMLMIVQSDNMATDAVLGLIGLESVERRMRAGPADHQRQDERARPVRRDRRAGGPVASAGRGGAPSSGRVRSGTRRRTGALRRTTSAAREIGPCL